MTTGTCVTLVGCTSGEIRHIPGGQEGSLTEGEWLSYVGEVVGINTLNEYSVTNNGPTYTFNDQYYTVVALYYVCEEEETECIECQSNILAYNRTTIPTTFNNPNDFINYVTPTGEEQCPATEAYVLQNCGVTVTFDTPSEIDPSPTGALVTQTDLAFYVGSVIRIEEYPDYCYTVLGPYTQDTGCPCPEFTVISGYKDCECCLPDLPPKFVRTVPDPVKQFYYVPNTECDIRINKKFAENYYKMFRGIAYGMENCCHNIDYDKLWIEMQLNDFSKINDPSLCAAPAVVIPPAECEAPLPTPCPVPTNITAEGDFD